MNNKNDTVLIIITIILVGMIIMHYVDYRMGKFEAIALKPTVRLKPTMNLLRPTTINIAKVEATNVMIGDHNNLQSKIA